MKTPEIMSINEYEAWGGSIKAVPVSDVRAFIARVQNRLDDIQHNGMSFEYFEKELRQVMEKLD
jgi:hypothetical protein